MSDPVAIGVFLAGVVLLWRNRRMRDEAITYLTMATVERLQLEEAIDNHRAVAEEFRP